MTTLEEMLDLDPNSASLRRATQLAANDRALLRSLVAVRKERRLSQGEVADRMGISQSGISRFEAHDSNPTLATVRRYAHAVEALVNHDVEADEGQLEEASLEIRWTSSTAQHTVTLAADAAGSYVAAAPFRGRSRARSGNLRDPFVLGA